MSKYNKKYTTTCVKDSDLQYRLLQNLTATVLECSDVHAPSCGHLGSKYFRLDEEQLKAYEKMSRSDSYTLKATTDSPVWGKLELTYERSATQIDSSWLPTTFYGSDEVLFTKTTVFSKTCNVLLPVEMQEKKGFSRFEHFLERVENVYCGTVFAFDPNKWTFLPRPRFSNCLLNEGLTAVWNRGEIEGYDYQLSKVKSGRDMGFWVGSTPSSRGPRRLATPI